MRIPVLVQVSSGAFGHQILDYEQILYNVEKFADQVLPIYFQSYKSANLFFLKKIKEGHIVLPHRPAIVIHKLLIRVSNKYRVLSNLLTRADCQYLKEIHERSICALAKVILEDPLVKNGFSHREERRQNMIGVVIRDSGYDLKSGIDESRDQNRFRNSNVDSFLPTFRELIKSGNTIIRFGRANKLMQNNDDFLYDLSDTSKGEIPDYFDFLLASRCDFFISTGSGPDCLAMFFRKPLFLVDTVFPILPRTKVVRKFLIKDYFIVNSSESQKQMSYRELKEGFLDSRKMLQKMNSGEVITKSKRQDVILDFTRREITGEISGGFSNLYEEVEPGVFY